MSTELQRARSRQMVIFLLVCAGMIGLMGRLYYWQIIESPLLTRQANNEHIYNQVMNAPRGMIYDTSGHLLATNVVYDDVYVEPHQFSIDHEFGSEETVRLALNNVIAKLHQALPTVTEEKLRAIFDNTNSVAVPIAYGITPEQSEQLKKMYVPYTFLEPRAHRVYPSETLAAQILGYVKPDGNGVYGIEGMYNKLLAGKPGSFTAERDLEGNPLTVGASSGQPAVNGANITLTIDDSVQYMVESALSEQIKKMQAQGGTAIVVDAHSGAIVAMASAPTFDPNKYGQYWNDKGCLNSVEVYLNPAVYCTYEPGSTMKPVTMAAALDQGLITPQTAVQDGGYQTFADAAPVRNWDNRGYGQETMAEVLAHSANVGAALVAHDILRAKGFYPYLAKFGFAQLTGITQEEQAGWYSTQASKGWTPTDLTRQAFGQSIAVTPLQMAMVYQAIANGGVMMKPYLVSSINDNGHLTTFQPQMRQRVISATADKQLTDMLVFAANYNKQATFPGYSVAVKTGTATTQGISDEQTEASMAGFLPVSNPRFVILVKLDRPQATIYGGTAAGPLWKSIAQQLVWHYQIPPDQQE